MFDGMTLPPARRILIARAFVVTGCSLGLSCGGEETQDTATLGCTGSCDSSKDDDSRDDERQSDAEPGDDASAAAAGMGAMGTSTRGAPAATAAPSDDEDPADDDEDPADDDSVEEPPLEIVEGIVPSAGQLLAPSACENRNPDWRRVEGSERGITVDLEGLFYTAEFIACHVTNDGILSCREFSEFDELYEVGLGKVSDLGIGFNAVAILSEDGRLEIPNEEPFEGTFLQLDGNLAIDQCGRLFRWIRKPDGPAMFPGPTGSYLVAVGTKFVKPEGALLWKRFDLLPELLELRFQGGDALGLLLIGSNQHAGVRV
jgi:hypothetical protein